MAILNWFGTKQDRARKEGQQDIKTKPASPANKKTAPQKEAVVAAAKKQVSVVPTRIAAYKILQGAHITEKSAIAQQQGKYTFDIFPGVESPTVKQAVEDVYNVHVRNVQIVKVRAQKRHRGRFASLHKRPNKAIVTLRKGETIDIMG